MVELHSKNVGKRLVKKQTFSHPESIY